jgi:2,5-diketo-D-gluconate reductase A
MVNQIEFHPFCQYHEVVKFCRDNGIVVQAYAPFASGSCGLIDDKVIKGIADRIGKSVGQVILRWNIQQGNSVIPKSGSEARMAQNLELFNFVLSDEDMTTISALQAPGAPSKRSCPDLNEYL